MEGTFGEGLRILSPTTFHLGSGRNADVVDITWSLTVNGVTKQARNTIRISR